MTTHRVAELCLGIRAEAGNAHNLRPRAERFARAVLERCADLVEAQAPGRLVFVRRLPLRWRLSEAALGGEAALERCAADAAAAIEEAVRDAVPPSPSDEVAVFADEAQWRAGHLSDRLRGRPRAWFYASLEGEGDPVEPLRGPGGRDLARLVLTRLAADGPPIDVLAALPDAAAAALAQALGLLTPGAESRPAAAAHSGGAIPDDETVWGAIPARLEEFARALPATLPAPALLLALYAEAQAILGSAAREESVRAAVSAALAAFRRYAREVAALSVPPEPLVPPAADDGASQRLSTAPPGEALVPAPVESSDVSAHLTQFGGLFYLLTCALELDLGEILWKACLPEGDLLAHACAALLGPDAAGDPAPLLFGGVPPGRAVPPVAVEQQQDVAAATVAALASAVPRRGLAALPEIVLDLVPHASGRLLVAAAPGSPFALFAWPAPSPADAAAGLRAFLRAWPRSAPPVCARPALAGLDGAARLQPSADARASRRILLAEAPSSASAALLAQAAGALGGLFAARIEALASVDAMAFVRRYLALPARVMVKADEIAVALPAESIDMDVRRAGLDRDPGWVPWLHRRVRFSFEDQAGEATS
jgi:hypothetical protein